MMDCRAGMDEKAAGAVIRALPSARRRSGARPVLVTGGAGFLGSNLVDRLARAGHQVIVYDNLSRSGVETNLAWLQARHGPNILPVIADLRAGERLAQAVREASAVIHLAAQVAVTTSLADPLLDFEVNARGTLVLLEALRAQPEPPPLIFASTNKVYGKLFEPAALARRGTRYEPVEERLLLGVDERTPLDLQSPYGCSKGAADQYVLDYARVFGLPTVVLRMSCLYGPRQFGTEDQGWVAHFLFAATEGRPITIYGDGCQVRDALYVDDAVDAYLAALREIDQVRGRAFNLGGGPGSQASLIEMLDRIAAATGVKPTVHHAAWRPGDQLWYVSDTRAFEAVTGWRAGTSLTAGLAHLAGWVRQQQQPAPARRVGQAR